MEIAIEEEGGIDKELGEEKVLLAIRLESILNILESSGVNRRLYQGALIFSLLNFLIHRHILWWALSEKGGQAVKKGVRPGREKGGQAATFNKPSFSILPKTLLKS